MKLEKKDIPKVLLLIGILIIGIGLCINFMGTDNKKKTNPKTDWKNHVEDYTSDDVEPEDYIEPVDEDNTELVAEPTD